MPPNLQESEIGQIIKELREENCFLVERLNAKRVSSGCHVIVLKIMLRLILTYLLCLFKISYAKWEKTASDFISQRFSAQKEPSAYQVSDHEQSFISPDLF